MISSSYRALLSESSTSQRLQEEQKELAEETGNQRKHNKPLDVLQYEHVRSFRGAQLGANQTQQWRQQPAQTQSLVLPHYSENDQHHQNPQLSRQQQRELKVYQMQQSKLQWQQQHNEQKQAQLEQAWQRDEEWRHGHHNKDQIQQQSQNKQHNPHKQRQYQQPTGENPMILDGSTAKQRHQRKWKEQQQRSSGEQQFVPHTHSQHHQQQQFGRLQHHQDVLLGLPLDHRGQQQHQTNVLKAENRKKKQQNIENRRTEQQQAGFLEPENIRQNTGNRSEQQTERRQQKNNHNIQSLQKREGRPQYSASGHHPEHTGTASPQTSTNTKSSTLRKHPDHSTQTNTQAELFNVYQQNTEAIKPKNKHNKKKRNRGQINFQIQAISHNAAGSLMLEGDDLSQALSLDRVSLNTSDVFLDDYNSDLNAQIGPDGWGMASQNTPVSFRLLWAGAKANFGVRKGKVFFEAKLVQNLHSECISGCNEPNAARIGWSDDSSLLVLGEEPMSFGFQTSRKLYVNSICREYGQNFNVNDVIGALLDLDSKPATISFMKNGTLLGIAESFSPFHGGEDQKVVMYPHVLLKNCVVVINFGQYHSWFPPPQGYRYIGHLSPVDKVPRLHPPKDYRQCQVIMIVGLPGSGKTTWAKKQQQEHPEKRYNILGTDFLIERMGFPELIKYSDRFNKLYASAEACFKNLMQVAATKRRNYILDQTNVFSSARKKKMAKFAKFYRIAAVIQPSDQELERRSKERAEEQCVPEWVVRDMKINYSLPTTESVFDLVNFIELDKNMTQSLVIFYNRCPRKIHKQGKRNPNVDNDALEMRVF